MKLVRLIRRLRAALLTVALGTTLVATPVNAATFQGEFWATAGPSASIDAALSAINGVAPTATFISTAIDYPNGSRNVQNSNQSLAQFLGADAASIVGNPNEQITTSVFRFTGFLTLLPGQQNFALSSDDGYRLTINNTTVSEQSGPRSFRTTALDADVGSGRVPFELVFYENFGRTGVEFFIDSLLAEPSPVPLPATATLSLAGLTILGFLGWRRRLVNLALVQPA